MRTNDRMTRSLGATLAAGLLFACSSSASDSAPEPTDGGGPEVGRDGGPGVDDGGGAEGSGGDAGPRPTVLGTWDQSANSIAVDATSIYLSAAGVDATNVYIAPSGSVSTCPLSGCASSGPTVLATGSSWLSKCALGGCGGTPTPLTTSSPNGAIAYGIAINQTSVYWTVGIEYPNGAVYGCSIGGCGTSPSVIASQAGVVGAIAVDATNAYFGGVMPGGSATLVKCSIGGCGTTPTSLAKSNAVIGAIAVNATTVYWIDGGNIMSCPIAGCDLKPTMLVFSNTVRSIALDDTSIYWTDLGPCPPGATEASECTTPPEVVNTNGSVKKCPLAGCGPNGKALGPATTIASGQDRPIALAVDATNVYWLNSWNNAVGGGLQLAQHSAIMRLPK
jgi:hypothetical protein